MKQHDEPPYPFTTLIGLINGFQPPRGKVDPLGDWDCQWGVHSVSLGPARAGTLRMGRKPGKDDTVLLDIVYRKDAPDDFVNQTQVRARCRLDALATPLDWTLRYSIRDKAGGVAAGTEMAVQGSSKEDHILLKDTQGERRLPIGGAFTANWCLFEAAHRFSRTGAPPAPFTLLDDFDQPVQGHTLAFREEMEFPIPHARKAAKKDLEAIAKETEELKKIPRTGIRLRGHEQLGPGILPTTYWAGDDGRLLFVIAGIEAYVWEPTTEGADS